MNYNEQCFREYDPDRMRGMLTGTEIEHRLLAGTIPQSTCCREINLPGCSITACRYTFPVMLVGCLPRDGLHFGFRSGLCDSVVINEVAVPPERLLVYPSGQSVRYVSRGEEEWFDIRVTEVALAMALAQERGGDLYWPSNRIHELEISLSCHRQLLHEIEALFHSGKHVVHEKERRLMEGPASEGLIRMLARVIGSGSHQPVHRGLSPGQQVGLAALNKAVDSWLHKPSRRLGLDHVQGIHPRVLEQATRLAYGVTPHRWLKIARLNAAFRDLLRGRFDSVTETASSWYFTHHGRFSAEYCDLFGEKPCQTLARADRRGRHSYTTVSNGVDSS